MNFNKFIIILIYLFFNYINIFSQSKKQIEFSGKIYDKEKLPLIGVSVYILGHSVGTTTNENGIFKINLNNPQSHNITIEFSFIGYKKQTRTVNIEDGVEFAWEILLEEDVVEMSQMVVTGLVNAKSKMESSVSISILDLKKIERLPTLSAADLLTNVAGIYVNSSQGEIRNQVYSRGLSYGSSDVNRGYYYVSLQEDGLPITFVNINNFGPDYFLRNDATLYRLEAIRGGSASITTVNAPGGIFNYISKTGGDNFEFDVNLKYGIKALKLETPKNYVRADLNFSGPIKVLNMTYNIGGFYRFDEGPRDYKYPFNNGFQIKGNLLKIYKLFNQNGSAKLILKYLNDRNGFNEALVGRDLKNPRLVEGINENTSFAMTLENFKIPYGSRTDLFNVNTAEQLNNTEFAVGLEIKQDLAEGLNVQNLFKFSDKTNKFNNTNYTSFSGLNEILTFQQIGSQNKIDGNPGLAYLGDYEFYNIKTGQTQAVVNSKNALDNFTIVSNNLPNNNIFPDHVLVRVINVFKANVMEIMDQFRVTKKFKTIQINMGLFYGYSDVKTLFGIAGGSYSPFGNNTDPLGIRLTQQNDVNNGTVYQFTDQNGILGYSIYRATNNAERSLYAGFINSEWEIIKNLSLDIGLRYELSNTKASNTPSTLEPGYNNRTYGGADYLPTTVYDNLYSVPGETVYINNNIDAFSYSGGINYKFNEKYAIFGRYTSSSKTPELQFYFSLDNSEKNSTSDPKVQNSIMAEIGFKTDIKLKRHNFKGSINPYYSYIDNLLTQKVVQISAAESKLSKATFNTTETFGFELEGDYTYNLKVNEIGARISLAYQYGVATKWLVDVDEGILGIFSTGAAYVPGSKLEDFSGNRTENVPDWIATISPYYSSEKINVNLRWNYLGERYANIANSWKFPGFSRFDLSAGYNIRKNLILGFEVNNVFNEIGIMGWVVPEGIRANINGRSDTFSKTEADSKDSNYRFGINISQPISMFFNIKYSFR